MIEDHGKHIKKGGAKIFKELAKGSGMNKKLIGKLSKGFGEVIYAHFKAPLEAARGEARQAVDTAVGAYGALAGGIIGGPIGAGVGMVIAQGPGSIISFYDTT